MLLPGQGRYISPDDLLTIDCNEPGLYTSNMIDSNFFEMKEIEDAEFAESAQQLGEAAALLSAVADPIRLRLLTQLSECSTACVCNLQTTPPIPDNLLSYHLKVLRDAGLVVSSRRGRWMDYSLTPGAVARLHEALPSGEILTNKRDKCDSDPS